MGLGTSQQTITTGAVFIPEVWSPEILRATENALVMAPLVKRFDSLVTQRGDTIHIPNLSNLTATSKSANVQVALQSPTESDTTISLNQHYESSFLVEDILKVQSNYDLNNIGSFHSDMDNKTISNQWGTPEMATLNKQEKSVQLQRLNEMALFLQVKRQSELLTN